MIRLVTFGRGGDTVYDDDGSRTTGYGNPDRPHAADGKDVPDGTPALDTRAAIDTDEGYSWAFRGPLCDPSLADGVTDECPEPSPFMAAGLSGGFLSSLALQVAHKAGGRKTPGPLDSVSVAEFVRGWREHGARVGEYKGGVIAWE